jgi:hypothetical protein
MNIRIAKVLSIMAVVACINLLIGCKIEITVPSGGNVSSASGGYDCASGETCIVEVNDFDFDEAFTAEPWEGWVFLGWKKGRGQLCGNASNECHLSSVGLEQFEVLAGIVQSEETFYLNPEFTEGTPIEQAISAVNDEILRFCLNVEVERIEREEGRTLQYAEQLRRLGCDGGEPDRIFLEGIEAFTGLRQLELVNFAQSARIDLQPLAKLIRLESLELRANVGGETFNDLSALADVLTRLTQLERLALGRNGMSDLSPLTDALTGLTRLKSLDLGDNEIMDITPLAGLTRLT